MSNHLHTDLPPLTLSFMGANFVARELGYGAADEWGPFDVATNAAFEPLETFGARLDEILAIVASAGFEAMDMWLAHLNWRWATPEHVAIARDLLDRHGHSGRQPRRELRRDAGRPRGGLPRSRTRSTSTCSAAWATCSGTTAPSAETVLREHGVRFALREPSRSGARRRCSS